MSLNYRVATEEGRMSSEFNKEWSRGHYKKSRDPLLTHLALVWTGPKPLMAVYSLKYCGIESPRKMEKPNTNFVLKLLRLQNWR